MALNDFINQNNGKRVGTGQCGELVDLYLIDCFGNHTAYNDAKDYWFNGIPGFVAVTDPQAGDIAVYNAHGTYTEGHIAIYVGNGEVFEQNADPDGSSPHTFPRATTYLLGYLRSQGEDMAVPDDYLLNDGDVVNMYHGFFGGQRAVSPEEVKIYSGKDWKTVVYAFISSDEFKARVSGSATKLAPGIYQVGG